MTIEQDCSEDLQTECFPYMAMQVNLHQKVACTVQGRSHKFWHTYHLTLWLLYTTVSILLC